MYLLVFIYIDSTRIWNTPKSGDIRLTKGNYSNVGLLEVYCNGEWGTVCDDTFNSTHAFVACNQLGYNAYLTYNHLIQYALLLGLYECNTVILFSTHKTVFLLFQ